MSPFDIQLHVAIDRHHIDLGFAPIGVRTFRDQSASIALKQHFLTVDLTLKMKR